MYALARTFFVFLLGCLGLTTTCLANDQSTDWACWLHSDQKQAVCMVVAAPKAWAQVRLTAQQANARALSAGQYLQVVREWPAELRGSQVFVPLHAVPDDETHVAELIKTVLCGAKRNCEARYQHDMAKWFAHNPEVFVDMHDLF